MKSLAELEQALEQVDTDWNKIVKGRTRLNAYSQQLNILVHRKRNIQININQAKQAAL